MDNFRLFSELQTDFGNVLNEKWQLKINVLVPQCGKFSLGQAPLPLQTYIHTVDVIEQTTQQGS